MGLLLPSVRAVTYSLGLSSATRFPFNKEPALISSGRAPSMFGDLQSMLTRRQLYARRPKLDSRCDAMWPQQSPIVYNYLMVARLSPFNEAENISMDRAML